jgi:putative membrane protein
MQVMIIVAILAAMGSVAFALQNNVPVTVTFLVWRFDSSLAMVLLMALALGALIVALFSTPSTLKAQWTIARLRKQIAQLEESKAFQDKQVAELEGRLSARQADGAQPNAGAQPIMPTFPMTGPRPGDSRANPDGDVPAPVARPAKDE